MIRSRSFARSLFPAAAALALVVAWPDAGAAQAPAANTAVAAPAVEVPLAADERQKYVGTYTLSIDGSADRSMAFRVYEEQGALYGEPQGGQAKKMSFYGNHTFRPVGETGAVLVFRVEGARATGFTVTTPEGVFNGTRAVEAK